MPEQNPSELRRAYEILGVPGSSSASAIKQAYHRLAKRWHPDLYPPATPSHADATYMMRLINEAYSAAAHAPLRYHIESYPRAWDKRKQTTAARDVETSKTQRDTLPINDRLEFWTRFVIGALVGVFISIRLVVDLYDEPKLLVGYATGLILVFALGSARYGDRFWSKILESWWLWW
jgi:hypothetical protein